MLKMIRVFVETRSEVEPQVILNTRRKKRQFQELTDLFGLVPIKEPSILFNYEVNISFHYYTGLQLHFLSKTYNGV